MILLTVIPIIHVYVNRINHKLVFEIKNGYKLELQTPESRKLFSSIKELINKIKKWGNMPSLEVVETVSFQCNLIDNQYQKKAGIIIHVSHNKSYACLLNIEPSNSVLLKT